MTIDDKWQIDRKWQLMTNYISSDKDMENDENQRRWKMNDSWKQECEGKRWKPMIDELKKNVENHDVKDENCWKPTKNV